MQPMLRKLIPAALAVGTISGTLAVATASPAHAATPNTIRRYARDISSAIQTPWGICWSVPSRSERFYDTPFTGSGWSSGPTLTCAGAEGKVTVTYEPNGTYGWDRYAGAQHKAHIVLTVGGVNWSCGDIIEPSRQWGFVTNTFPKTYHHTRVIFGGNRTCANGMSVYADLNLEEGWAAIVK